MQSGRKGEWDETAHLKRSRIEKHTSLREDHAKKHSKKGCITGKPFEGNANG
jgi:hypothetical protein